MNSDRHAAPAATATVDPRACERAADHAIELELATAACALAAHDQAELAACGR
jgi:hypothetical protein